MPRSPEQFMRPQGVKTEVWGRQLEALEQEREGIEEHRQEAHRMVSDLLTEQARILVLDFSEGMSGLEKLKDGRMRDAIRERQAGGIMASHADFFRDALGFDPSDERVDVWKVYEDPKRTGIPYPDVWFATGGPAMPSELHPGNETENTPWLQRAVDAMQELEKAKVPGLAVCLGHQLWEHSQGAVVGRRHPQREFGTVRLQGTPFAQEMQMLVGILDDEGGIDISASHNEAVMTPPVNRNLEVIALNSYSDYQGAVHALGPGERSVGEAIEADEFVLSIQNHPEVMAILLAALRELRAPAMRKEGLKPEEMIFHQTPEARKIFLRFLEVAARRVNKRT